jgi:hypothetical protein
MFSVLVFRDDKKPGEAAGIHLPGAAFLVQRMPILTNDDCNSLFVGSKGLKKRKSLLEDTPHETFTRC